MSKEYKNNLVPKLRFPEFKNSGKWAYYNGNVLFDPVTNKNHNSDLPILAITQEHGAIPRDQIDYNVTVTEKSIESYKVDRDSIQILKQLDTKNNWAKRKEIIRPTISTSFCQIIQDIKLNRSLGIFKPSNVEFSFKKISLHDPKKVEAPYKQYWLFDKQLKPLEQIPFSFYYKFNCYNEPKCKGHKLSIHDWEITEAYRQWRSRYKDQTLLIQKIQEKWMYMCGPEKDVYFFVGNIWRRPKQFMVLGVFYPPK